MTDPKAPAAAWAYLAKLTIADCGTVTAPFSRDEALDALARSRLQGTVRLPGKPSTAEVMAGLIDLVSQAITAGQLSFWDTEDHIWLVPAASIRAVSVEVPSKAPQPVRPRSIGFGPGA